MNFSNSRYFKRLFYLLSVKYHVTLIDSDKGVSILFERPMS
jgi:hypothetical protein